MLHLGALAEGVLKDCHVVFADHRGADHLDQQQQQQLPPASASIMKQAGSIGKELATRAVRAGLTLCGLLCDKDEADESARLEALFGLSDIASLLCCTPDTVLSCLDSKEEESAHAASSDVDKEKTSHTTSFRGKRGGAMGDLSGTFKLPLPPRTVAKGQDFAALALGKTLTG